MNELNNIPSPTLTKNYRFTVYAPRFPSYLISSFKISNNEFSIDVLIAEDSELHTYFQYERNEVIDIHLLDGVGNITDKIRFEGCDVKNVEWKLDWEDVGPHIITITYTFAYMYI